eukprot:2089636-Pyramimonas_sp.AAC.1
MPSGHNRGPLGRGARATPGARPSGQPCRPRGGRGRARAWGGAKPRRAASCSARHLVELVERLPQRRGQPVL